MYNLLVQTKPLDTKTFQNPMLEIRPGQRVPIIEMISIYAKLLHPPRKPCFCFPVSYHVGRIAGSYVPGTIMI